MTTGAGSALTVHAAGAIPWRTAADGEPEVLLVHSARYGDWSWPKGKPDEGETLPETAVREVAEESGVTVRLGRQLPPVAYTLPDGRRKRVTYWAGRPLRQDDRTAGPDEIDDVAWVPVDRARELITRPGDGGPLDRLLTLAAEERLDTRALVVVRHARAVPRKGWDGEESDRPLTEEGRAQAGRLVPLLACWRPDVLLTSPWARCLHTLAPYARADGNDLFEAPALTEESGLEDPEAAAGLVRTQAAAGVDVTLCTHRPVLPEVIRAIADLAAPGVRDRLPRRDPWLAKAELLVLHVSREPDGPVAHAAERHRAR